MADTYPRPRSRNDESELWFSMPSSARREQDQAPSPEQTAYQATSSRHSAHRSASPSRFPSIPLISTTAANKPLPPSPESEKKKRKPVSLRSLVRRRPSSQLDPSHLQPNAHQQHQRSSSANGNLSPEPYQNYYQSSRSMPTSPSEYSQTTPQPVLLERAHSAAANYADATQYAPAQQPQQPQQQRAVSMSTYFEPQPPRARRTFPETNTPSSATAYDPIPDRQRPHTWLSPTEGNEPFDDETEFHLFVEATSGLPDGTLDFGTLSPSSPPHLQGSLFARGRQNDTIPLPLQNPSPARSQSHQVGGWQTMGYDYMPSEPSLSQLVSSSALPRPDPHQRSQLSPNLNNINLELERLGMSEEREPEDELPDYAQSQAEMSAKRRREATDRARELEARWNNSRGWRGR